MEISMRCLNRSHLFVAQLVYLFATICAPGVAQVTDGAGEIRVFSLVNATASEMANVVDALLSDEVGGLAIDKRTNSLIVRAPSGDTLQVIEALLMKLDEPDDATSNQARRENLATTAASQQPVNHIAVRTDVSAAIAFLVEDGKRVKKGDLIVELDDAPLVAELRALQVEIEEIKAGELEMRADEEVHEGHSVALLKKELELAEMRLQHVQAEAELESIVAEAEKSVAAQTIEIVRDRQKRLRQLFTSGQANSDELDELRVEAAEAKAAFEVASAKEKLLASKSRPMQIVAAELEIARARIDLDVAERSEVMRRQRTKAHHAVVRLQLEHKQQQLQRFEEERAKCKIHAPADGVVRYGPHIAPGAEVRARQTVLLLEP
jgi:multidrug resistance efflux pump